MAHDKITYVTSHLVEELIRGIGHDVGAPARHIVHFSQMLSERDNETPLDDKHLRWLDMIHDSGKLIQSMLSGLSQLSRMSIVASNTELLDLGALFNKQLAFHQEYTLAEGSQLETSLPETWPTIEGNKEHWQTLFSCLLENACKFQPNNTEHIVKISVSCTDDGSNLRFVLEDNGIGVRETQWENIPRPFKRLHSPDEYEGIGMGLAYCNFIAELNQAHLRFGTSKLGGLKVTYKQPKVLNFREEQKQ